MSHHDQSVSRMTSTPARRPASAVRVLSIEELREIAGGLAIKNGDAIAAITTTNNG